MMKYLLTTGVIFICYQVSGQVGIGTVTPSAQLEISNDITNPNFPLLELNPQTSPVGSATGQLAVIGDKLFMYDTTRGKWLSVETSPITFSRSNSIGTTVLRCSGNVAQANTAPLMPFNGTIVAITGNSNNASGSSNPSKEFDLRIRNGTTTNHTIDFNLTSYTLVDTTQNVDFSAGEHFTVRARDPDSSGDTVNNPVITIWVKWRE